MRINTLVFFPDEELDMPTFERNLYNIMINFEAYGNDLIDY